VAAVKQAVLAPVSLLHGIQNGTQRFFQAHEKPLMYYDMASMRLEEE
jgi:hypothetical protein